MLEILLSFFGLLFLVGFVIFKLKSNKDIQKTPITANMPKIEIWGRAKFTEGYCMGTLKSQLPRKNGTTFIEFFPDDVEQGEKIERPKVQSFIAGDQFIKRLGRGNPSSRREKIIVVSRDPTDYPEQIKETLLGNYLTTAGQLAFLEKTFGKAIPSGDEALAEAMKEYARGQVTKNTFSELKESNKKFREIPVEEKPKET